MTRTIKLKDDVEVEVEIDDDKAYEISNGVSVESSIDQIESLLTKIMKPVSNTYRELNKDMSIETAKIAVGIKIGIEGNFILAKSSASANISVEMTLKAINKD